MIMMMMCLQLQFLFELPVRLQKCLDNEAYSQAVRYLHIITWHLVILI